MTSNEPDEFPASMRLTSSWRKCRTCSARWPTAACSAARDTVGGAVERLTDYAEQGGGPGLMAAVTGAKSMSEGKSPMRSLLLRRG